jgi:hypothetical protein
VKKLLAMLAFMTVLFAVSAVSASADTTVTNWQKLRIQVDPSQSGCNATAGSSAGWVTGTDSPLDSNSRFLSIHVGSPTGCVVLYSNASVNKNLPAANQKNLSYEFRGPINGLGEFYMGVQFNNGDIAFLDPYNCHHDIATAPTWQRSDFTGFTTDCSFNVDGPNTDGGFEDAGCLTPALPGDTTRYFCADGTHSAWANYVAANSNTNVIQRYMVFSFDDWAVDRISLGVGKMYTKGNGVAVSCTSEASC